jgi:hypothetical protein
MGVDSYLEIFTTLYGWTFGRITTTVLLDTGLYLLPILFMLIATLVEGHERGLDGSGVQWLVRKLEVNLYTALFVFVMCVQPMDVASLSKLSLLYEPTPTAMDPAPTAVNGGNTGTSFDTALGDSADIAAIPPWWYMVMSLSSGMSSAVRAGVGSSIKDIRALEDLAHTASMPDPRLRNEVQRFYSECYVPARSRYLRPEFGSPEAAIAINTYGEDDTNWIGSHAFRDAPQLYADLYARQDVPGFPYDPARDTDVNPDDPILPTYGRPSCKAWWETPATGLRAKMISSLGTITELRAKVATINAGSWGISSEEVDDGIARIAMNKARPSYIEPEKSMGDERAWFNKALHAVPDLLGGVGTIWKGAEAATTMMPLITMMTMMQPLILMGIYMFMQAAVIFSGYNLQLMVTGAVAIFTVKFYSVMWFLARWVDDHLIEAMYPDGKAVLTTLYDPLDQGYKRLVLNILLLLMYIGLPLLWTAMMAWAGHRISGGIADMMNVAVNAGQAAGKQGLRNVERLAKKR